MTERQQLILVAVGMAGLLTAGAGLLIWPAYRENHEIHARIDMLTRKAGELDTRHAEAAKLEQQLDALRAHVHSELKIIPDAPDIAGLIRKLSLPVDGLSVHDQEFVAGQSSSALLAPDEAIQATPLTIELTATFETIFALLRSVESMDRLVRIASVHMGLERSKDGALDAGNLAASVGLEAIFVQEDP
jgi:Tfp pilus assembly protein PilO